MTECTGQIDLFSIGRRKVTIESNGTFITSSAGVLLASRIEQRRGLAAPLSGVLRDEREPALVTHSYERARCVNGSCRLHAATRTVTTRRCKADAKFVVRHPSTCRRLFRQNGVVCESHLRVLGHHHSFCGSRRSAISGICSRSSRLRCLISGSRAVRSSAR